MPLEAEDAAGSGAAVLGRGQKQPGEGMAPSPPLHLLAFSLATGADSATAAAALPAQFEARTVSMDDIGGAHHCSQVSELLSAASYVPAFHSDDVSAAL